MSRWQIPSAWEWVTAGQIAEIIGGGTPPSKNPVNFVAQGIPWITPADLSGYDEVYIERGARDLSEKGYGACGARLLPKGTVLYTSRAPVGYCVIAANEICTNQGFKSLRLFSDTSPEYIRYYLLASKEYAESLASGSTFLELSGRRMSELNVPLASAAEQRRIADKITILDTHARAARKHLDAIPPLLEQFRASVLSAAFSGRLTADWREEQKRKGVKIETADALLERMRLERRQRWEEEQRARMKAKGRKPKDDSWKKKYKEPAPVEATGLPELPEGWCWTSMSALAECALGKMLDKTKHTTGIKLPYLRNVNVRWDEFQTADLLTMFFRKHEIERYQIRNGDAVVCEGGEPGRAAVWRNDTPIMYQKALHRLRPFASMDAQWLVYHLSHDANGAELSRRFTGTTIKHFTGQQMAAYPVRLPSLSELHEVIRKVDLAMMILKHVVTEVAEGYECIEKLENCILAKAFRGELVPQDPTDEPATELLKRIAEEKKKMHAAKNATPRKGARRGR